MRIEDAKIRKFDANYNTDRHRFVRDELRQLRLLGSGMVIFPQIHTSYAPFGHHYNSPLRREGHVGDALNRAVNTFKTAQSSAGLILP
jgi:hypothetical protein